MRCIVSVTIAFLTAWLIPAHAETLRILGNQNLPPYIWQDEGNSVGLVVDLMYEIAERESLAVSIETMEWTVAQSQVAEGKADALLQINPTSEREQIYDFSSPLLESRFHIFHRASEPEINIKSMAGKLMGVEKGGLPQQYLKSHPEINVFIVPDWKTGFEMLKDGRLDAVFLDQWVGEFVLHLNNIRGITLVEPAVVISASRIAVKKGNHALLARINAGLAAIQADGTRASIERKWEGKEVVFVSREKYDRWLIQTIVAVIALLAGLLVMAIAYYYRTRKLVLATIQNEQRLQEQECCLKNILEGTNVGTWEWNIETGETRFNERWAEIIGYSLAELQPISIESWIEFVHPDDLKHSEALLEQHFAGKVSNYECETRMRHKDGRWVWILDRGKVSSWTEDGKPLTMHGTHQDITERKHATEELIRLHETLEQRVAERTRALSDITQQLQVTLNAVGQVGVGVYWVDADSGRFLLTRQFNIFTRRI